jgi:hypothetical protein
MPTGYLVTINVQVFTSNKFQEVETYIFLEIVHGNIQWSPCVLFIM